MLTYYLLKLCTISLEFKIIRINCVFLKMKYNRGKPRIKIANRIALSISP